MVLQLRKKVPPPPGCPMSACMSLLGGVWTPEIIWNLSQGPRRFSELRRAMPAISAKVLSGRLKDLDERGVLARVVLPTTPPSVEYALTDLGQELIPAIRAIVAVGSKLHRRATSEGGCAADAGHPAAENLLGSISETSRHLARAPGPASAEKPRGLIGQSA